MSSGNRDAFRNLAIKVEISEPVRLSFNDVMQNVELEDVIGYFGSDEILEAIDVMPMIFKDFCIEMWDDMTLEDVQKFFGTIKREYTSFLDQNVCDGSAEERVIELAKGTLAEFSTPKAPATIASVLEDITELNRAEQIVILNSLMGDLLSPFTSPTTESIA